MTLFYNIMGYGYGCHSQMLTIDDGCAGSTMTQSMTCVDRVSPVRLRGH